MNDIQLKHSNIDGKYDWSFNWNDLDVVRGKYQLINACKHAVLLRPDELIQDVYQGKGCTAHNHIYTGNTEEERELAEAGVETSVKDIDGVYDARCTLVESDEYTNNVRVELITEEMEEVTVDGI